MLGSHRLYFRSSLAFLLLIALTLSGCVQDQPAATSTETTAATETETATSGSAENTVDLSGIKSYLVDQATALKSATAELKQHADTYYGAAEAQGFDYAALWEANAATVTDELEAARAVWMTASPLYEQIEGIVAGTPSLASYDVILDAGASGEDDPENAVPFDLTLPNGQVLPKPGNLFGVTESTLWGTFPAYTVGDVEADWNQNGALEFGETLPDANVLKAGADALDSYAGELLASAQAWEPTTTDAFTALVVMVPTMNEYFGSWRDSRFVVGETSTQRDFVAISRLSDIQDILGGLEIVYAELLPLAESVDTSQAAQIGTDLSGLRAFVADIYSQEQEGKRFTPEEADLLGVEAQDRATSITGRISQIAAQLGIEIEA
ncbi:MAG: EfeM/EfeO family lipoprotein [Caldilineaceae bacterium]|nr:EfeM/EfeO family lipoprotein [Caldilineaceae bacterium]